MLAVRGPRCGRDARAVTPCDLVVPLPEDDPRNLIQSLEVRFTYVGQPPISEDQVTVSFRVADEDDG